MPLLIPTEGENKNLECMLGKSTPGNLTLKLFVNDKTPVDGDTSASYTEMSTQGYAAKTLLPANWTVAQDGNDKAEASYAEQQWTFDGTGGSTTIYGYYIVDAADVVRWAERFTTPRMAVDNGDLLRLTPKFTFSTE